MMRLVTAYILATFLTFSLANDVDNSLLWETIKNMSAEDNKRPPVILIPGLICTRLIAWKKKSCRGPDINTQDIVWLNLQKMIETVTYDPHCWLDCMKLGK